MSKNKPQEAGDQRGDTGYRGFMPDLSYPVSLYTKQLHFSLSACDLVPRYLAP